MTSILMVTCFNGSDPINILRYIIFISFVNIKFYCTQFWDDKTNTYLKRKKSYFKYFVL